MKRRAFALSFIAAANAGCGFVSDESAQPPFAADGINDFGAATPIEICVGPARVVSPSVAGGTDASLCVDAHANPRACTSDSACDRPELCVCGICTVEACSGSSCGNSRVCRDNRCTTACAHDKDCASDEKCELGGCARRCTGDGACHFGEHCDPLDLVCITDLCGAIPCGPGQICRAEQTVFDLREPEVATINGAPTGFLQLEPASDPKRRGIYPLAIESDTRWSFQGDAKPLVSGDDDPSAPAVLANGDLVEIFFSVKDGSAIGHAVSHNGGKTFTRDAKPALVPVETWEKGSIGSPAVISFGGGTLLAYEGGAGAGIGLAAVDESGVATRISKAPIASPSSVDDPIFWRDVSEVRAPYLAVADTALRIYFTGRGIEAGDAIVSGKRIPAPANDSIGMVATRDLVHFDPYPVGPVYSRVTNLRDFLGESEAAIQIRPNGEPGASIIFVSADSSGKRTNGLARAGSQ